MKNMLVKAGSAAIAVAAVVVVGCAPSDESVVEAEAPVGPGVEEAAPGVEIERAPEAVDLIGAWKLTAVGDQPAASEFETTISFDDSGRVSGNAGCNNFSGEYSFETGALAFAGPMAATRKMCPPPMMEQEDALFKGLDAFESAAILGDTLSLYVAGTEAPLVFSRVVAEPNPAGETGH